MALQDNICCSLCLARLADCRQGPVWHVCTGSTFDESAAALQPLMCPAQHSTAQHSTVQHSTAQQWTAAQQWIAAQQWVAAQQWIAAQQPGHVRAAW